MAYSDSKTEKDAHKANEDKLKLYAGGVILLVIVALLSVLIGPGAGSSATSRCDSLVLAQSRYGCIISSAMATHNSTMCNSLSGSYRDACYFDMAVNTTNAQLCTEIESNTVSDQCYIYIANYTNNAQLCSMVAGSNRSSCAYGIALKTSSTADCGSVNGSYGAMDCNATVYFNRAVDNNNATSCAKIYSNNNTEVMEEVLQNSSLGKYNGLSFNVSQMLELMSFYNQSLGARDICYAALSYKLQNTTYCTDIENPDLSAACTDRAAQGYSYNGTNQTSNTTNISALLNSCNGQANETQCRYTYMVIAAKITGNVTMCRDIPSSYSSLGATCFYNLAIRYNSTSYCSYIANSTLNSACVGDVEGLYPTTTNLSDD